jgi:hypothetical protein
LREGLTSIGNDDLTFVHGPVVATIGSTQIGFTGAQLSRDMGSSFGLHAMLVLNAL